MVVPPSDVARQVSAASVFSLVESPCRSGMPPGIASHLPALGVVSGRWARPMGASSTACLPPMWYPP